MDENNMNKDNSIYRENITKYKKKIDDLTAIIDNHEIGTLYDDNNNNTYLMFITGKLVEKSLADAHSFGDDSTNPTKKRKREHLQELDVVPLKRLKSVPLGLKDYILNLTPAIKMYVHTNQEKLISEDLKSDQILIDGLENIVDIKDPTYLFRENRGKLIECWIADNLACPNCGQRTLRRYYRDNFPIIDMVCINQDHTFDNGVRFFQVKSSLNNMMFDSDKYFDLENGHIHVGSRKLGEVVHNIKRNDLDITKKILIGYICIIYLENDSSISILGNSFLVLPKTGLFTVKKKLFYDETVGINEYEQYYWYLTDKSDSTQIILFSKETNEIKFFNEIYGESTIPLNYMETTMWVPISNPLNVLEN